MGKKLAIKGHSTRGKEVIALLEMMGGIPAATKGFRESYCYYIDTATKYISWDYIGPEEIDTYKIFTLEEFLEKYPFKVGDKAVYIDDNDIIVISEIMWDNTVGDIFYNVKRIDEDDCFLCPPELLKLYKDEVNMKDNKLFGTVSNPVEIKSYTVGLKDGKVIDNSVDAAEFMQIGKIVAVCFNMENYENEVELKLGNYEIIVRDGKTYAVLKKPKYPKTYEECCKMIGIRHSYLMRNYMPSDTYKIGLIDAFQKLLICRDTYWKIAGEEMGLDKPWEPDWSDYQNKYGISCYKCTVTLNEYVNSNRVLCFPTKKIRDAFYENFKDLIEQCKELL